MNKLQYLFLAKNNFSNIPVEIAMLQSVEYLYLNENNLSEIPSEVGNLMNLEILDLSGNNISEKSVLQIKELLPNAFIIR